MTAEPRPDAVERLDATVRGRVQGVGFRYWVIRRATGLGLTGWVANERDGSVHCVAEGPATDLDELEGLLRNGPAGAIVETVQAVRMPATGRFTGFEVRSSGHAGD
ncbi:MAG TPA: acylphosphatase [Candidatus Limnocylindrales bacterium]|jgi:acylphosphatase